MPLNASALGVGSAGFQTLIQTDRQFVAAALDDRVGVIGPSDFLVTPNIASHAVDVNGGRMVLAGANTTDQGSYFAWSEGPETIPWPAPSGQARIDTLILRVADPQYGTVTGTVGGRWDIIQGVPSASPVAKSDTQINTEIPVPGAWERVADIRINTADTGVIPGGQITDKRRNSFAWKSWTPTFVGLTPGNGLQDYKYRKIDPFMSAVNFRFTLGSTSSITDTVEIYGLPFDPARTQSISGYVSSAAASRSPISAAAGPGNSLAGRIVTVAQATGIGPGNPFAWSNGASIVISGILETQPW